MTVADAPCCVASTHRQGAEQPSLPPLEVPQLIWLEAPQLGLVHLVSERNIKEQQGSGCGGGGGGGDEGLVCQAV